MSATAAVAVVLVSFATLVGVSVTMASPASGVTPTLLARGAYADFKVKSIPGSPVDLQVKAKSAVDVVVRSHDYAIGSHTGWHSHPGPVFITVKEGTLTYYLYDDPTCTACRTCGVRRRRARPHGAQRVRCASPGRQRDHRADGRRLPGRARRTEPELRLLRNEPDDRRGPCTPPASRRACMALFKSPLTDSNPRPLLTMEVCPLCVRG